MNILVRKPAPTQIDWTTVPAQYQNRVSAVVRTSHEAEALVQWYGSPDWVPALPVLLRLPSGDALIGIEQERVPMAARALRDQAIQIFEQEQALMHADTRGLVLRERGGPVQLDQRQIRPALIRQAEDVF